MENELRLGNAFCQKGSIFVEYATFETFDLLRRKVILIEPVPITEKWLLKFGFKKLGIYIFEIWLFEVDFRAGRLKILREGLIDNIFKTIKYIHQLQNLYFSLTGEELKIKEL